VVKYFGVRIVDSTPLPIRVGSDPAALYRDVRDVGHVYRKVNSPADRTRLRLEIASEAAESRYGPAPRSIDWGHDYLAWLRDQVHVAMRAS
jgi:hypothetical protein